MLPATDKTDEITELILADFFDKEKKETTDEQTILVTDPSKCKYFQTSQLLKRLLTSVLL